MAQRIGGALRRGIPWHEDASWWLLEIEGVAAVIVGLAVVLHPHATRDLIIRLMGLFLVVGGLILLYGDFRGWRAGEDRRERALRHLAIVIIGAAASLNPGLPEIIAYGFIILGIIGLIGVVAFPNMGESRWGVLVASAVALVTGVALVWALAAGTFFVGILGLAILLCGLLIVAFGLRIHQRETAGSQMVGA
jgi:uncharacterized membrane protein HdeD (DUF308 family)